MNMKILHVITGMQKAAGTSVFAGEVANELVTQGYEVAIAVAYPNCEDCYKLDPRVKLIGFDDVVVADYDIVHVHALWSPVLSKIAKAARKAGVKVVWSPHGMLTPWALKNKWWKKFAALALYQYRALKKADLIHVTAQSEVEDVRRLGLKNEVVVAPLGVRVNDKVKVISDKYRKTLLFVSRVQRKKGLPNLLEAWARLPEELKKNWTIRIVGPDQDNHTAELKDQASRLGVADDVVFVGPKYDEELDSEYRNADLFVLPTHSENFGSVVIEALAHSVPVVCTKAAPWGELEGDARGNGRCGWWIEDSVQALQTTLARCLVLREECLAEYGKIGLELAKAKYEWKRVGKILEKAYREICND